MKSILTVAVLVAAATLAMPAYAEDDARDAADLIVEELYLEYESNYRDSHNSTDSRETQLELAAAHFAGMDLLWRNSELLADRYWLYGMESMRETAAILYGIGSGDIRAAQDTGPGVFNGRFALVFSGASDAPRMDMLDMLFLVEDCGVDADDAVLRNIGTVESVQDAAGGALERVDVRIVEDECAPGEPWSAGTLLVASGDASKAGALIEAVRDAGASMERVVAYASEESLAEKRLELLTVALERAAGNAAETVERHGFTLGGLAWHNAESIYAAGEIHLWVDALFGVE